MMISIQLALFYFSTLLVTLRNSTNDSVLFESSSTSHTTCVSYVSRNSIAGLSNQNYLNIPSITSGDTSDCHKFIIGMDEVIAQYPYVSAALLIHDRQIILSHNDHVGIGEIFDSTYDPQHRAFVLGKSVFIGAALLESKLRELFFYGFCHHSQLLHDNNSNARSMFRTKADKEKLLTALKDGHSALKQYIKNFKVYKNMYKRKYLHLKESVENTQHHYTYPNNKDALGNEIYKNVDPLLAVLIETGTMFMPEWIDRLTQVYGENHAVTVRIALLYAEIPKPIIENFFPEIKKYVDTMTLNIFNNYQRDELSLPKNPYTLDEIITNINDRTNKRLGYK